MFFSRSTSGRRTELYLKWLATHRNALTDAMARHFNPSRTHACALPQSRPMRRPTFPYRLQAQSCRQSIITGDIQPAAWNIYAKYVPRPTGAPVRHIIGANISHGPVTLLIPPYILVAPSPEHSRSSSSRSNAAAGL